MGQRELTVEEQLLAREARDGVKRNKVFYIEDEEASLEKTAGRQVRRKGGRSRPSKDKRIGRGGGGGWRR